MGEIIIKCENITKKFKNKVIFDKVNFEVEKGSMVALVGESGSGKSTLLNIIGNIIDIDEGELYLFGEQMKTMHSMKSMKLRREKISYLFQNYGLVDDDKVIDNLLLGLEYSKYSKKEKRNVIEEELNKFSIKELMNKYVYELSGGEQQRVALIRAILQNTELILADEPTGSLDEKNRDFVFNKLKELNESGKTVIIATHDKELANKCNKVFRIENGNVVERLEVR